MMYDQWKSDPESVHASWKAYFKNIEDDVAEPYIPPPTVGKSASGSTDLSAILEAIQKSGIMQGATVTETTSGMDY